MDGKFAELCGIIAGDGHLGRVVNSANSKRNDYIITISGNKTEDLEYYNHVSSLFHDVFNKKLCLRIAHDELVMYAHSKRVLEQFENAGITVGKKAKTVFIPKIILNDEVYSRAFLRGLADTDFSMTFKKAGRKFHSYPKIVAELASRQIIEDIKIILQRIGINYLEYFIDRQTNFGHKQTYRIEILGKKNLQVWMNLVGFKNPKHLTKIKVWEKCGYCPPFTTILERKKILEGKLPVPQIPTAGFEFANY